MKKPAAKVKPRPVNPKGTKKTPAAASAAPAVPAETTNNSVLAPEYQTLSKAAASVYTAIAPKSILLTSPEAAKILTTPARSLSLVSLFPTLLRFFRTNCSSSPSLECHAEAAPAWRIRASASRTTATRSSALRARVGTLLALSNVTATIRRCMIDFVASGT